MRVQQQKTLQGKLRTRAQPPAGSSRRQRCSASDSATGTVGFTVVLLISLRWHASLQVVIDAIINSLTAVKTPL